MGHQTLCSSAHGVSSGRAGNTLLMNSCAITKRFDYGISRIRLRPARDCHAGGRAVD
jgi:hypothetical protein